MDLVNLSKDLQAKVNHFANTESWSNAERFQLREEIRTQTKRLAYAVDGPEQAIKDIARGVCYFQSCHTLSLC